MKKTFSILFAMLILASGMHYSIATHFCGGEIASKKLSISGSVASCGMESSDENDCSNPHGFNSNCCKNQIETYSIDTKYENAAFKISQVAQNLIQEFYLPISISFNSFHLLLLDNNGASPPRFELASAVDLPKIRIFRI